jgi:hypothetical protein
MIKIGEYAERPRKHDYDSWALTVILLFSSNSSATFISSYIRPLTPTAAAIAPMYIRMRRMPSFTPTGILA